MVKKHNPISEALRLTGLDQPLPHFDWSAAGIEKTYLILFTGRTGSTLLTKLMEQTGLSNAPDEYFTEAFIGYQQRFLPDDNDPRTYLTHAARTYGRGGVFGAEIDSMRLRWMEDIFDFSGIFPASTTPYVWMTRTDIVSQAFSFVSALMSGRWHIVEGTGQIGLGATDHDQVIRDEKIWNHILKVIREEQGVEAFLARQQITPFRVSYEEFVADKILTVSRIMRHVGIDMPPEMAERLAGQDPTRKLTYSSKYEFMLGFENRNADAVRYLRDNRHAIDLDELQRLIPPQA